MGDTISQTKIYHVISYMIVICSCCQVNCDVSMECELMRYAQIMQPINAQVKAMHFEVSSACLMVNVSADRNELLLTVV